MTAKANTQPHDDQSVVQCSLIRDSNPNREMWTARWASALILIQFVLLAWSATQHSPNTDELPQLAAGVSHWRLSRFELYRVTPPLVRMIAAIPAIVLGANDDWSSFMPEEGGRPDTAVGRDFREANREQIMLYIILGRWMCLPFAALGATISFRWATELFGSRAGLAATALWCFCPNILANAQLITTDAPATSLLLAAGYCFWHWLQDGRWSSALLTGAAFGGLWLTKSTFLVLSPAYAIIWLVWRILGRRSPAPFATELLQGTVIILSGLYLVNACYGFDGTFRRLGDFQFISRALKGDSPGENRFSNSILGLCTVPLPAQYVLGADYQRVYFEEKLWSYLNGEWKHGGWWYYYLYCLIYKTPIPSLVLFAVIPVAGWKLVRRKNTALDLLVLMGPAILLFTLVSSQTGFNKNFRYVLPVLPTLYIASTIVFNNTTPRTRWIPALATVAVFISTMSSLAIYPHSLSYFNQIAGGPANGHHHLLITNIDWGQDLFYLKDWVDAHPECRPLHVAFYGAFNPQNVGIDYSLPAKKTPDPGWYAVSINTIMGHEYPVFDAQGNASRYQRGDLEYLLSKPPAARVGYSIFILHFDDAECAQFRRQAELESLESGPRS